MMRPPRHPGRRDQDPVHARPSSRVERVSRLTDVGHLVALHPFRQVVRDVGGAVSDSSLGRCTMRALSSPDASSANSSVAVTSSAFMVAHSFRAMM